MNLFYLIRHGDKNKTMGDPSLSPLGQKQAKLTAAYLRDFPITKIYTSPLKRCRETAAIIGATLRLPVEVKEKLRERINWGDDPKLSFDEFLKVWEKTSIDRDFKPRGGDSSRQAGERLAKTIQEIAVNQNQTQVVLVTSGGIITDFLRNTFSDDYLKKFRPCFPKEREKDIKECSITIVKEKNNNLALIKLAYNDHLSK